MWEAAGGVLGGIAATIAAVASYRALQAKRVADEGSQQIAAVNVSLASLKAALEQSDKDRQRFHADLVAEREAHQATRRDLLELGRRCTALESQFANEQRVHADRIKVLVRHIRRLGGDPAEDGEHDD